MARITKGSDNIYADLGLPDAERMRVKATLALEITRTIQRRGLTQMAAAALIGMPQPKLSGMLRGEFRGISETKMLTCLNRLGHDVEIVVRPAVARRSTGRTRVVPVPAACRLADAGLRSVGRTAHPRSRTRGSALGQLPEGRCDYGRWQPGHQYVVRPPWVSVAISAPQRVQGAPARS
jgi:predicted XRE-type DNA-binding protein